jgi:hypothetical protein
MMTKTRMLCARAGASAIAAALALSPTYAIAAAAPAPIVDLSKSAAVTGKADAAPAKPASSNPLTMIGQLDQQTLELGGGAIAILILGACAVALSRSRQRRREEAAWNEDTAEMHDPLFDEPMFADQRPAATETPAFAWGGTPSSEPERADGRRPGESWVERAYRGPTPDNPSLSLRRRLKRAAFFDKREREAAQGKAEPVEPDAGLPENVSEQRELEAA